MQSNGNIYSCDSYQPDAIDFLLLYQLLKQLWYY